MNKKIVITALIIATGAFLNACIVSGNTFVESEDLRLDDREAIDELMWRYARALDTLNADAYVGLFTQDGEFSTGQSSSKGHDGLRALIKGVLDGRKQREAEGGPPTGPMFHTTSDSWIEFVDGTHARHHSYWMTAFGPAEPGGQVRVAAVGRGVDYLVKENGKWLIQKRDVAPED